MPPIRCFLSCNCVVFFMTALIATVSGYIMDSNKNGQIWARVKMPSGNTVWQLVDACPLAMTTDAGASLIVETPSYNDVWLGGNHAVISWRTCGNVPAVRIDLYYGFHQVLDIDIATPNTGSYNWKVMLPRQYPVQNFYTIRVTSLHDSNVMGESKPFRIAREFSAENVKILHPFHAKFGMPILDEFHIDPNV